LSTLIEAPLLAAFAQENELSHEAQMEQLLQQLPEIYYAGKSGYWLRQDDMFIPLPREAQVAQHLVAGGVSKKTVPSLLCHIRTHRFVSHAGPVAGYPIGLHTAPESATPYLVTHPPRIIESKMGECSFIERFLTELFGDQKRIAIAHLRQARINLRKRQRRPLPALALVGPRNCGKSMFIEICRRCLGGRAANAFAALSGESFNADTLGAELLVIDDEIASKDYRARTALAQGIKKNAFAGSVRFRPLYHEAINMRPIQMTIIAVNDETEHLQVLPVMDESMRDKLTLLHCSQASLGGIDDREEISRKIDQELPAFLHMLENSKHPMDLHDQRTGAKAWQNPGVLARLQTISAEQRFRELLLQCSVVNDAIKTKGFWEGTAAEVEQLLTEHYASTAHAARSLLTWNSACGSYLGRLEKSGMSDITNKVVNGFTHWKIRRI
jgi:hypothetical protein